MNNTEESNTFLISCACLYLPSPCPCFEYVSCLCQAELSLYDPYQGCHHEQCLALFLIDIFLFPVHCLHALNVWCSHQGLLFEYHLNHHLQTQWKCLRHQLQIKKSSLLYYLQFEYQFTKSPWKPALDRACSLNIHQYTPAINLLAICMLVGSCNV
jgi:hypothetical protein